MTHAFITKILSTACMGLLALSALTTANAQTTLRVTTIPEEAATEQVRKFTPLANYLEKQLGMKVQFTPVTDYPAAVESLVNKKVDVVWFGGFTFVQASIRSGGKIIPLAQRERALEVLRGRCEALSPTWRTCSCSSIRHSLRSEDRVAKRCRHVPSCDFACAPFQEMVDHVVEYRRCGLCCDQHHFLSLVSR